MEYVIGLDIGTSGTKAILFDKKLNAIASATENYALISPYPKWAEQNPNDWWNATSVVLKKMADVARQKGGEIASIGLCGQMHGLVLLDENDEVIRNAIIWCDGRTQRETQEITRLVGKERLVELTANPALTAFTASKLRWVYNNEPQNYLRIKHILLPKDYIRFKLTGKYISDYSDASGTQLLDISNRIWSSEIVQKLNIDMAWLPKLCESAENTGFLTQAVCDELGLSTAVCVAGGAGDQAAGAIGNGIIKPGDVSVSLGTSGVIFAATSKPVIDKKASVNTFCHAVGGMWHVMTVTQGFGLSISWLRDNFCEKLSYRQMDELAENIAKGSDGVLFLPYIMGERSPINDVNAKGVWFGLCAYHTKANMIKSVLEGVALSQRHCYEAIVDLGIEVNSIKLAGGGAKSLLLRQIVTDCLNRDTTTQSNPDCGCVGGAILAGVASNLFASIEQGCSLIASGDMQNHTTGGYEEIFKTYLKLYLAVKGLYE